MDSGSKLEAVWARNLKVLLLGWDGLEEWKGWTLGGHIPLALSRGIWWSRKRHRVALKNGAKAGSLLFESKVCN